MANIQLFLTNKQQSSELFDRGSLISNKKTIEFDLAPGKWTIFLKEGDDFDDGLGKYQFEVTQQVDGEIQLDFEIDLNQIVNLNKVTVIPDNGLAEEIKFLKLNDGITADELKIYQQEEE